MQTFILLVIEPDILGIVCCQSPTHTVKIAISLKTFSWHNVCFSMNLEKKILDLTVNGKHVRADLMKTHGEQDIKINGGGILYIGIAIYSLIFRSLQYAIHFQDKNKTYSEEISYQNSRFREKFPNFFCCRLKYHWKRQKIIVYVDLWKFLWKI